MNYDEVSRLTSVQLNSDPGFLSEVDCILSQVELWIKAARKSLKKKNMPLVLALGDIAIARSYIDQINKQAVKAKLEV